MNAACADWLQLQDMKAKAKGALRTASGVQLSAMKG